MPYLKIGATCSLLETNKEQAVWVSSMEANFFRTAGFKTIIFT
jgi:hypothetical protein